MCAVQDGSDALGGAEEDQRVLLVLGGHVPLHQHQPAVAARRAQRRWLLRVPGRADVQQPEGSVLHQPGQREPVRAPRWVTPPPARPLGPPPRPVLTCRCSTFLSQPQCQTLPDAVRHEVHLQRVHQHQLRVYVVQQHEAVRGLQRLRGLLPLRTVHGVVHHEHLPT